MLARNVASGPMTVFETADILADHVAAWLLSRVAGQASAAVCLSGGSTPKRLYERLAGPGYIERFPWDKVHWFWGDERFVPVDHPDNNYRMVKLAMLSKAPIPMDNIHPIETDASDAAAAAAHYERVLQFHYGADRLDPMRPLFDVTLLGLGPDGHTASLIPGQSVLNERERWAAAVTEGRPEARITLTYPPLESSRAIAFLVTGSDKAAMLAAVRRGDAHVPAAGLRSSAESHWFVDRAAAGE